MTDVYKKVTGTELAPGTTGAHLKLVDTGDGHAIAVAGLDLDAIETAVEAVQVAVEALDNAISGAEMQVDIVSGNVGDNGPGWTSVFGLSGTRVTSADAQAGTVVTDAPTAGQKLVITDILVSVDTQMRVDFKEETSGTVIASIYMAANSSQQITFRSAVKLATADKQLEVHTSAAGNIAVLAAYYSES